MTTFTEYFEQNEKNAGLAQAVILAVPVKAGEKIKFKGSAWASLDGGSASVDGWQIIDLYYQSTHEKAYRFLSNAEFEAQYKLLDDKSFPSIVPKETPKSLNEVFRVSSDLAMDTKPRHYAVKIAPFKYLFLEKDHSFSKTPGGALFMHAGSCICRDADNKWRLLPGVNEFNKVFRITMPPRASAPQSPKI